MLTVTLKIRIVSFVQSRFFKDEGCICSTEEDGAVNREVSNDLRPKVSPGGLIASAVMAAGSSEGSYNFVNILALLPAGREQHSDLRC